MSVEECAICGEGVPFGTTTHVLVNPKHEDDVADHYVCRPCYDEHLEGLFVALAGEDDGPYPDAADDEDGPTTSDDGGAEDSGDEREQSVEHDALE